MSSNYFILFNFEPDFNINLNTLECKYIELNKRFHPDANIGKHQDMANINKAYSVLKSPLKRAEHLLNIMNVEINASGSNTEILNEAMEIREYLSDHDDFQLATKVINRKTQDCINGLTNAFAVEDFHECAKQILRLKYLNKSLEEVKKNAANSNF